LVFKIVSIEFSTYIDIIQTETIHTTINFFHPLQTLQKNPPFLKKFCFQHTIQTSNRVEWAYAPLKMSPMKSLADICKKWESINTMLTLIFIELHKEFQKSIISREPRFTRTVLCSELLGNISNTTWFLSGRGSSGRSRWNE
jgi:hypothetical protein